MRHGQNEFLARYGNFRRNENEKRPHGGAARNGGKGERSRFPSFVVPSFDLFLALIIDAAATFRVFRQGLRLRLE
jgi:hypothetical protein